MPDTTLRHMAMLREVPGRPWKTTASQLCKKLSELGYRVGKRTVERDLIKLSAHYALRNDGAKPLGWFWDKGGDPLQLPSMDLGTAISWQLVERYLTPLFPQSLLNDLKVQFNYSHSALARAGDAPLGRWPARIEVIFPGPGLIPPRIRDDVRAVVYEALLHGRQCSVNYQGLESLSQRSSRLHPLGLVLRAGVLYLIATADDYSDPRQWALHRMSKATLLDDPAAKPEDFDFGRYVHEMREFDFPTGRKIRLELDVAPWLARHLSESRLALDQTVKPLSNAERSRVSATVMENQQLEWWLRSLGTSACVIRPVALRNRIVAEARAVADAGSKAGRGRRVSRRRP